MPACPDKSGLVRVRMSPKSPMRVLFVRAGGLKLIPPNCNDR